MNDTEFVEISEFIYALADNSKKLTLEGFYSNLNPEIKIDGSPVTQFDINAEKIICSLISNKFPSHNIFAEEISSKETGSDYTWIVDPIDGTRSYIIGRPLWGTLIGLAYKGKPLIGLVDFPALNERWLGYKSNCFYNKSKFNFKTKLINKISDATVGSTDPNLFSIEGKQKYQNLIKKTKSNIWSGDSHNYCLIIRGGLDLVVEEGLSAYDILPLVPILESQDIIVTDWNSNELTLKKDSQYRYSTVVSRHNNIYDSAITLLK
jgi:inositol-phosphate phosphatase / L-galactose 1-phosphate phosphatase / histidinol-phosphatase